MNHSCPRILKIPVSSINFRDNSYSLRPNNDANKVPPELKGALRELGLLHPPLVECHLEHYVILSGRKRILAACELGWQELPCLVLGKDTPTFIKWKTLLTHALIGSQLSSIEQAHFFAKAGMELDSKNLLDLMPLLGHKPNPQLLATFSRSLTLAPPAINALHHGLVQQKSIDLLHACQHHDQETLIELIEIFQLGGSKQRKLILLALDLTKRHNTSLHNIISEWKRTRREKDKNNRPQQAADLLNWLAKKQSPRHQQAQQDFRDFVQRIKLPPSCSLLPSTSFEDEQLTLKICFSDRDSFCRSLEQIRLVLENNHE